MTRYKKNSIAAQQSTLSLGKRRAIIVACVMLGFGAACGEEAQVAPPTAHDFPLQVTVTDANEIPVAKAPVVLDGSVVGYTDRDGKYEATLTEFSGTEVTVAIGEMEAYMLSESAQVTTTLKRVKTIDGFSNSPVRLSAALESIRNDYLVWVDFDCAEEVAAEHCQNLPIKMDGKEVARTDEQGRAHFDFKGIPEQQIKLEVDTPVYIPKQGDTPEDVFHLTPAKPSYELELGLGAEVLTIKETLSDPAAAERIAENKNKRRAAARRRAARKRKAKKKKAAKKAKEAGVIDLW